MLTFVLDIKVLEFNTVFINVLKHGTSGRIVVTKLALIINACLYGQRIEN